MRQSVDDAIAADAGSVDMRQLTLAAATEANRAKQEALAANG